MSDDLLEDKKAMLDRASRYMVWIMVIAVIMAGLASFVTRDPVPIFVVLPVALVTGGLMLKSKLKDWGS